MGTLNLEYTLKSTGIIVWQVDIFRNLKKNDGDAFSEISSSFSKKNCPYTCCNYSFNQIAAPDDCGKLTGNIFDKKIIRWLFF